MSLDLYIISKKPVKHKGTGIYIRENGQTKELSLEEANKLYSNANIKVQTYNGNWTRQAVANDPSTLYIFTDNTDRNSGSGVIPADSWYSKKYGAGHHFPTMTTAVIRGLDNARPISTQRWYHYGAKGITGRWNDGDFNEFKKVIDDEFEEILKEWNTGKYKTIMFPQGDGLFNTRISNISIGRTPKLYQYLYSKYQNLINTVNGSASSDNLSNKINPVQKVLSDKTVDMQKTLSLPNFEHFVYNRAAKDLKGIEIDYPWKESYLKELDSQFRRMEDEDDEYWHNNITSNLRKMSEQCVYSNNGIEYSLYRMLWHPEETGLLDNGNVLTKKYVTILLNLLNELQLHKDKYEMYNPANGWGSYDTLYNFVDSLIASLISINNNDYKNYTVVASY